MVDAVGTEWVRSASGWGWERVGPSPVEPALDSAEGRDAWTQMGPAHPPPTRDGPPWEVEGGPEQSRWLSSDSQLAAQMMNAAVRD